VAHSVKVANGEPLPVLLERNASLSPLDRAVFFEDGTSWTHLESLREAYGSAEALFEMGITEGSRIAIALPNGEDFLAIWWGATMLGAVIVPVNLAYRGDLLRALLVRTSPALLVADRAFTDSRSGLDADVPIRIVRPEELRRRRADPPSGRRSIGVWDTHALMLTSGTTGPSKLVVLTHQNTFFGGSVFFDTWECTQKDIFQVDMPWYHSGAFRFVHASLSTRTQLAVKARPDLDHYWEVARDNGTTLALLFGSTLSYLRSRPVRAVEREHSIRVIGAVPLPPDPEGFRRRFGIDNLHTAWGSTEVPAATYLPEGVPPRSGCCGIQRPGFTVRVVDETDQPLPDGQIGEAVVRTDLPWIITHEYFDLPAETSRAWRNGWFHTGDLMRRDADGYLYFVDRAKDAVRRRGENISSFEVEQAVRTFPGVAAVACVAARQEAEAEDEVKVWVTPEPGVSLDFEELLKHCVEKLPHFMVPRFFEVTAAMPETHTGKVEKARLRHLGNGSATWDREEHGYRVTRHGLQRAASA
jgi:carnitine-CoA ligase